MPLKEAVEIFEKQYIRDVLRRVNGSKKEVVMKLIDIQKTTMMAPSFGTNVRVISWIEVKAWNNPTKTPARRATPRIGTEMNAATQSPCRNVS